MKKLHYHLVGIEGVSMAGIAKILNAQGQKVTGSDLKLKGHSPKNITNDIDILIYTSAAASSEAPGFIEIEEARRRGIKTLKRSEFIGELLTNKTSIAISGMHGKTTVSAMAVHLLRTTGLNPSWLVGVPGEEGAHWGKDHFFVAEACEFDRSFLDFHPEIGIITNIEEEHLDYFKGGLPEIIEAFEQFGKSLVKRKILIINGDDKNCQLVIKNLKKNGLTRGNNTKIVTFGFTKKNDFHQITFELQIPGRHNLLNGLAILALAQVLRIEQKIAQESLKTFPGAPRRLEIKREKNNILVIDDYGHHPTEIKTVLGALKEKYPRRRLVVLFQPHQYSRTKLLFNEFAESFGQADKIIITDIYAVAGREEKKEVKSQDLAKAIQKRGKDVSYSNYSGILTKLKKELRSGDLLLTMGATDIYQIGEEWLKDGQT